MQHVIALARLVLRPVHMAEAAELHTLLVHEDVCRYLTDGVAMSREWVEGLIRASAASFAARGLGLWSAREHGGQLLIGLTGFRDFYTPPVFELLYAVQPSHWHCGFATEIAQAAMDYAFRHVGLQAVRASTDAPNQAALRVLERLGMRPHGRTAQADAAGVCWDQLHFIVSREEWQGRQEEGSAMPHTL
jgi:ribosomal-protein-alanine N-acetyltransferase